jgi:hypothetical protein
VGGFEHGVAGAAEGRIDGEDAFGGHGDRFGRVGGWGQEGFGEDRKGIKLEFETWVKG